MHVIRFLIRRLLVAIPTLMGICVVTFALIHLPPGDPLDSGGGDLMGQAPSAQQAVRRLYFLDLPLFYNADPRGIEARVERLLGDLRAASPGTPAQRLAVRRLRGCGTACLPLWAPLAAGADRARLGPVLSGVRGDHPGLGSAQSTATGWAAQALQRLTPASVDALAATLGRDPGAAAGLARLGTAALPAAMERLLDGEGATQIAASQVVSDLTGLERRLTPATSAGQRQEVLAGWTEWWFQRRREYVSFAGWERAVGRVTQTQFAKWITRVVTLRFGASIHSGRQVSALLAERLPITLFLSLVSMALAYLVAVPLGVHAAVRRGSLVERVVTVVLFVLYSLPAFWVAIVLILLLGGVGLLDLFPITGLSSPGMEQASWAARAVDWLHHLVLPVLCLTYGSLALISRHQRSAMMEVLRQDYILAARARGLPERVVIFRHALRNALLPVITLIGIQLPYLISGSVIIERIFGIPGMGLLTFEAFLQRDFPVIMAVSVITAALTLAGLVLSDLAYAAADPRISLERR